MKINILFDYGVEIKLLKVDNSIIFKLFFVQEDDRCGG